MNRFTRLLAIAGMGLGAAVALAGPAQAASADAAHKAPVSTKADWGNDDRVVAFFNDPFTCNRVGRIGEIRNRWDDYDCFRVGFGWNRGHWALSVSENDWDDWNGPFDLGGHHFGGQWGGFRHTGGFFHGGFGDRDHRR
jgi:hypothetical protein